MAFHHEWLFISRIVSVDNRHDFVFVQILNMPYTRRVNIIAKFELVRDHLFKSYNTSRNRALWPRVIVIDNIVMWCKWYTKYTQRRWQFCVLVGLWQQQINYPFFSLPSLFLLLHSSPFPSLLPLSLPSLSPGVTSRIFFWNLILGLMALHKSAVSIHIHERCLITTERIDNNNKCKKL